MADKGDEYTIDPNEFMVLRVDEVSINRVKVFLRIRSSESYQFYEIEMLEGQTLIFSDGQKSTNVSPGIKFYREKRPLT